MKKDLLKFLFLAYVFTPFFLFSQESSSSPSKETTFHPLYSEFEDFSSLPVETSDFKGKFFNMLFILGLIIGFMILASFMLKKMMHSRVVQINEASLIKVLETRSLSPRTTLYVLEIQGKNLLVAESPTGTSLLTNLSDKSLTPT